MVSRLTGALLAAVATLRVRADCGCVDRRRGVSRSGAVFIYVPYRT